MHCFHIALSTAVEVWVIIYHVIPVDLWQAKVMILPTFEHRFWRWDFLSVVRIRLGIFGSVWYACSGWVDFYFLNSVAAFVWGYLDIYHVLLIFAELLGLWISLIHSFPFFNLLNFGLKSLGLTKDGKNNIVMRKWIFYKVYKVSIRSVSLVNLFESLVMIL